MRIKIQCNHLITIIAKSTLTGLLEIKGTIKQKWKMSQHFNSRGRKNQSWMKQSIDHSQLSNSIIIKFHLLSSSNEKHTKKKKLLLQLEHTKTSKTHCRYELTNSQIVTKRKKWKPTKKNV